MSNERLDEGDVCNECLKHDRTIRKLEARIDDYQTMIGIYKADIEDLRGKSDIIYDGCKTIKSIMQCLSYGCWIIFATGIFQFITKSAHPEVEWLVPEIGILSMVLSFIGGSVLYSISSNNFINSLMKMYLLTKEK